MNNDGIKLMLYGLMWILLAIVVLFFKEYYPKEIPIISITMAVGGLINVVYGYCAR